MKETYEVPKFEVIELEQENVILTSNPHPEGSGDTEDF